MTVGGSTSTLSKDSLVPRPHPAHISLFSITRRILKAIHAGVGFGSETETSLKIATD